MDTLGEIVSTKNVPISTLLSVKGPLIEWPITHDRAAKYANYFTSPYGLRNAFTVAQEIPRMARTKLPDSVVLMIEVIGWVVLVPVMGMILTLIGESIYASLVIAH
jgi:hypothetical protein